VCVCAREYRYKVHLLNRLLEQEMKEGEMKEGERSQEGEKSEKMSSPAAESYILWFMV
jgi:hypothetical protein